jgi:tetratricopeptide (TPR) repeat protein
MLDKPFRFPFIILSIMVAVGLLSDAFLEPPKAEEGGQRATTQGPNSSATNIIGDGNTVINGEDPQRAEARHKEIMEGLARLAYAEGVPLDALRAILASMGEEAEKATAEEVQKKLTAKAAEFKELTDRLNRLSNADPEVARLRREAADALTKGRFKEADAHLAMAEARELDGLTDLEAQAKKKRLSAAESRAQRAAAALLRINPQAYRESASHYAEASRIAKEVDAVVARTYASQQGQALVRLGDEFGQNDALLEAIKLFHDMLPSVSKIEAPLQWAMTQNNLGTALRVLGERESGAALLEEAATAFREALRELTREQIPIKWAATQNNLGIVLLRLGERESGAALLEEAAVAFREALKEYTRERIPLDWAMTQNNLGAALHALGERESGTARLEEAAAAFREALRERTRERVPLDWAETQNNLGAALHALGERESGTARLEKAVAAYRKALKEYARERVPLDWAMSQNNLGAALHALGERESGTARLEEAAAAFREALKEYTRERVPLKWAMTQNNLGAALHALGERESGTERLEEAVAAFREALKEYTRERVPLDWAMTQHNLGAALHALGERESGTERLREALAAFDEAREELTCEQKVKYQDGLGIELHAHGELMAYECFSSIPIRVHLLRHQSLRDNVLRWLPKTGQVAKTPGW